MHFSCVALVCSSVTSISWQDGQADGVRCSGPVFTVSHAAAARVLLEIKEIHTHTHTHTHIDSHSRQESDPRK